MRRHVCFRRCCTGRSHHPAVSTMGKQRPVKASSIGSWPGIRRGPGLSEPLLPSEWLNSPLHCIKFVSYLLPIDGCVSLPLASKDGRIVREHHYSKPHPPCLFAQRDPRFHRAPVCRHLHAVAAPSAAVEVLEAGRWSRSRFCTADRSTQAYKPMHCNDEDYERFQWRQHMKHVSVNQCDPSMAAGQ